MECQQGQRQETGVRATPEPEDATSSLSRVNSVETSREACTWTGGSTARGTVRVMIRGMHRWGVLWPGIQAPREQCGRNKRLHASNSTVPLRILCSNTGRVAIVCIYPVVGAMNRRRPGIWIRIGIHMAVLACLPLPGRLCRRGFAWWNRGGGNSRRGWLRSQCEQPSRGQGFREHTIGILGTLGNTRCRNCSRDVAVDITAIVMIMIMVMVMSRGITGVQGHALVSE